MTIPGIIRRLTKAEAEWEPALDREATISYLEERIRWMEAEGLTETEDTAEDLEAKLATDFWLARGHEDSGHSGPPPSCDDMRACWKCSNEE